VGYGYQSSVLLGKGHRIAAKCNIQFREKVALLDSSSSSLLGRALTGERNSGGWPLHTIM